MAEHLSLESAVAIDVHAHVEMSEAGGDSLPDELRDAAVEHFRGESARPTAVDLARYYRERQMMAVVFTFDSESFTGQTRVPNEEIAAAARANADVLIPFASIDPHKGKRGVDEARRLIAEHDVRGFKFHPNVQAFFPNDRLAYPLYELIEEAGLPALFHTGHSGVGSGLPGGGGIRLKYSNPMHVDDVAVDFPDLKIVLAHPSFPWQDEAISIALHKPQVYIDLSGWSPKYFPPQLVHYANTLLRERMLFGSDYPFITPDRWLADFDMLDIKLCACSDWRRHERRGWAPLGEVPVGVGVEVVGKAVRKRHDRERRVDRQRPGHERAVSDVEALDVPGLSIRIDDRPLRVAAHAAGPLHVGREQSGPEDLRRACLDEHVA
jgi:predicted TIM-barrel fold metal-dependent hydrolase